jgi:glutamate-1-semialdehyde aminotransferase
MYFSDGSGCSLRDVDGHEYTDYLMAFGAILLGYGRPEVNAAAQRQLQRGALLSLNHPLHLELVEALLNRLPGAEMAAFFKTGSEATTAALRIAREHTGRRAVARAGYHVGPGLYLTSGSFDVRIQQAGIVPPPTALGDARRTARYCA